MNVWKVDGFRLQKMAMVWLWARAKEQIEAFADSSWSYGQPRHRPTRSLTQTTGALAFVHFSMRDAKCAVTRALWKVQPRAVDAEHAICVNLCLGRGIVIVLWAGRLYHTSDDGILKPLSMRQLLQHWQQAQLHGHRTISRGCVASFLRKWKRYEQREWLCIEQDKAPGAGSGDFLGPWTRHLLLVATWMYLYAAGRCLPHNFCAVLLDWFHAFKRSRWWRAEACPCFAKACGAPAAKFASHWANTFSPYNFRESKNVVWNWLMFFVCSHMLRSHTRNHGAVMDALSCPVA